MSRQQGNIHDASARPSATGGLTGLHLLLDALQLLLQQLPLEQKRLRSHLPPGPPGGPDPDLNGPDASRVCGRMSRAHLQLHLLPDVSRNLVAVAWRLHAEEDLLQLWKQFVSATRQLDHLAKNTGAALRRERNLITSATYSSLSSSSCHFNSDVIRLQ